MKIGFIGCGNMASAILGGIAKSKIIDKKDVYVSNRSKEKLDVIQKKYGFNVSTKNSDVINKATDIIFICVKPQIFDTISNDLKKQIKKNQLVVSIMAGKNIKYLENALGTKNVIRVMPNTPCLVGAGISAVATNIKTANNKSYEFVLKILETLGEAVPVEEKYINIITQISGASPAWIFMFIEALADGGVECGMPRDMAYKFAKSAVMGSGKLAMEKDMHVGALKDMVTSPAGTTIEGVRVLEENGFRGAIIDAVMAAYGRACEL